MKGERDSRTAELPLDNVPAANGGAAQFPGGGESLSASGIPNRMVGKLASVPAHHAGVVPLVAAVNGEDGGNALNPHGEYGRIRMLQDRLDEAERLRSAIHRASKLQSRGFAKLAVKYADILHRLHRDDEAIALLDRIEPVLRKYPVTLNDHAAIAVKLREAMKVRCVSSEDGQVLLACR